MQVGWVKIGHFRQITRYNSKTVQDRLIVSIKSRIGTIAFFVAFLIFVVSKHRDFIWVYRLIVADGRQIVLNFGGSIHISGMAEARAVKFRI